MSDLETLPNDIILEIFSELSPRETRDLILGLSVLSSKSENRSLINLLYKRLFGGKIIVEVYNSQSLTKDTILTIDSFKDKFYSGDFESKIFLRTRPNIVEFRFIRRSSDYSNFLGKLYEFNSLLECDNSSFLAYLTMALQLNFYLDGNLFLVENPVSFSVIILKILINISKVKCLSQSLKNLTIKSTDIGESFVVKWSQLLERFSNLECLNLANNLIKSSVNYQDDLLCVCFKYPARLKVLNLDRNLINHLTSDFLEILPHTLEVLLIADNRLVSLNFEFRGDIRIIECLPNIKRFILNQNHFLSYIHPSIFIGAKGIRLEIKGCNLEETNLKELKRLAEVHSFDIIT
ncbi:uncharacterized protein PRCAT00003604001 [Priceomyces carsonii]|uniref:uncharacterized protein n=1 Tax=Priceomyces carsonii TaxID=28549 RepID=UPI002ED8A692|nr:unnamed protein product [Priceomyces carsonii]